MGPVPLSLAEVGVLPRHVSGVYLLHSFSRLLAAFPVFYVGQSGDLRRRLLQHLHLRGAKTRISAIRLDQPAFFSVAPVLAEMLDPVEAALIAILSPVCNDQHPATSRILVNLPPLLLFGKD